jgi:SAM-dependent methyltransferase
VANEYSQLWQSTFARTVPGEQTDREVGFLERWLPRGDVLDVCCGFGRHALRLRAHGYRVVGVERDPRAAAAARREGLEVVDADMRDLAAAVRGDFDGVVSMWSSLGFYDDATNDAILAAMRAKLRPGGRLVIDTWNPDFHLARQGERRLERAGRSVLETKRVVGDRMLIRLDYGEGTVDELDFRLYRAEELAGGLDVLAACCRFDESEPPREDEPRMQLVLGTG